MSSNADQAGHTAAPWTHRKDGLPELNNQRNIIDGPNEELIAYGVLTDEDAEFIVRAVNAHDDLVKALKGLLRAGHSLTPASHEWNAVHAALSRAGA